MRNGKQGAIVASVNLTEAGASLARADCDEQAEFFKAFLKELRMACETCVGAQMQLHMVNSELSNDDKDLIACLGMTGDE
jgi:hypothetical protein